MSLEGHRHADSDPMLHVVLFCFVFFTCELIVYERKAHSFSKKNQLF